MGLYSTKKEMDRENAKHRR